LKFHFRDLFPRNGIVAEILDWKPDSLITHNLTGCGFGTPRNIQSAGASWIHFLHDVQLIEPSGKIVFGESFSMFRRLWRWKWSVMRRFVFGSPDVVISPTKWLLDFHQKFGFFRFSKSVVIPNPTDWRTSDIRILADVGHPHIGDSKCVVYIGRLDEDKGVLVLLDAWKSLGVDRPTLHLIGQGDLRERLESEKLPDLRVHGQIPHDRIAEFLQNRPVVIVPSLVFENQPTVILEALAFGCPIVATDVGGISETLGQAGLLVAPGNANALAEGMRSALQNQESAQREEARRAILESHRVEVVVDALGSLLKSNL
jgi:glycosyltransferase involved in cell wall biosynthesis